MDTATNYIYKKDVNWSLLTDGISIPLENQVVFSRSIGQYLKHGESKNIFIYLNGKTYPAKLSNLKFNLNIYPTHKDILQIRYNRNGDLAQALRDNFFQSYQLLKARRALRTDRKRIILSENEKEYLAIYTTAYPDTFIFEAILRDEVCNFSKLVKDMDEQQVEHLIESPIIDDSASIITKYHTSNIRKLNRKIGENLKLLYDYRCQICGEHVGQKYGTQVVQCHHIDYFSHSLNNNSNNLLIVCPNHHNIIHSLNPKFYTKRKLYLYPNGLHEILQLNYHL